MPRLHLELVRRADSAEEFARLARGWLTEARTELFPELSRRLPDAAVLKRPVPDPRVPIGPPDATFAGIAIYPEASVLRGTRSLVYSPRAFERTLSGLASDYPYMVSFSMMPLSPAGRRFDPEPSVSFEVRREPSDPVWVRFMVDAPEDLIAWSGSAETQMEWVRFLERWAARLDACYGHLTDDANDSGTALEMVTQMPGIDPPTVPRCREVLRGYSWVTICAPELVRRLGGVAALAASGAFAEVRELPGGQVLLQATPLLDQYQGTAVERVFQVLAPVLLPGRVTQEFVGGHARLVVGADAADFQ